MHAASRLELLDICKSSVCTWNRRPFCPLRLHLVPYTCLWASVDEGIEPLEFILRKGQNYRVYHLRNPREVESVRPLLRPAGQVFSPEFSVVVNISFSVLTAFRFWLEFRKSFFRLFSILVSICFTLNFGVGATVSLSFDCFSILIRISTILLLHVFSVYIFSSSFH